MRRFEVWRYGAKVGEGVRFDNGESALRDDDGTIRAIRASNEMLGLVAQAFPGITECRFLDPPEGEESKLCYCPHRYHFGGCWNGDNSRKCGEGCRCECHENDPPAAHTSDGTPVYTVDSPAPSKQEGKLASAEIREWSERLAEERQRNWGQPESEDRWDALLHVLDERLGRAQGKAGT